MEKFSEMVARARREKGLSVRDLEKILREKGYRVSFAFISFTENERKRPSYSLALALADVLGIDPEEALASAYATRMAHSKKLERRYLDEILEERGMGGISSDEIIRKAVQAEQKN